MLDRTADIVVAGDTKTTPTQRRRLTRLDDTDMRIIELLQSDGRLTNRVLANATGLTETPIAARIRSLTDSHVFGITAVFDWVAAGFNLDVWLALKVTGRDPREVSTQIASVPGVHLVSLVFGPVDIFVHGLVSGVAEDIQDFIAEIASIPGITQIDSHIALDTLRYTTQYARLPIKHKTVAFPDPAIDLDETDLSLIEMLRMDGRQSNRAIARDLGVSEGTVRGRVRRLENVNLLRIVGQSDPYLTGQVNTWAYIWVDTEVGATRAVAEQLATFSSTYVVAQVAGRHNLLLGMFTPSRTVLLDVILRAVRTIPGVVATETWEVAATMFYRYEWGRILPSSSSTITSSKGASPNGATVSSSDVNSVAGNGAVLSANGGGRAHARQRTTR